MDTHITLCALSIDYMWLSMLFFNHRNGHGLHRHTVTPPHTWRHIAHGPPDTHIERRAYNFRDNVQRFHNVSWANWLIDCECCELSVNAFTTTNIVAILEIQQQRLLRRIHQD